MLVLRESKYCKLNDTVCMDILFLLVAEML